jgi:thioredoxin 1
MLELNESNFAEQTSTGVVLVDFYADWCGPCRLLGQRLVSVSGAKILKVNIDQNQALTDQHNIDLLPTILFMKDGVIKERLTGVLTLEELQGKVDKLNAVV